MNLQHKHRLLLVDDEVNVIQTLKRVLHKENYDIHTASSGKEGLRILSESNTPFSLIISDQQMPHMKGTEFLEQAKQIFPDTIRVLLTGYSDMDALIDAVNKGKIHKYVQKPWIPDDMVFQIRQLLVQYEIILKNKQLQALTEKQNAELKELNRRLDEKVQKRTLELRISNEKLRKEIIEYNLANEARLQLSTAIEQADEIIIIADLESTIIYVNPAFERVTGYAPDMTIGQNINIFGTDENGEVFYKGIRDTILKGQVWKECFRNTKKDGTHYDVSATISPIRNSEGRITGFVNIARDITDELKMETKLRQAQKMEAIGTLASGIAHDFKNIVLVITGYAELGLNDTNESTKEYQTLNRILSASNRAQDLVGKILTFSRLTETEKKPVHLIPIINEICEFIKSLFAKKIEVRQQIEAKNDLIFADPTQIHQLFMNLCTNSGHAMNGKKGLLEILITETVINKDNFVCL